MGLKDATYWAEQIQEKKISPMELLIETRKKVQQLNPTYNAIVATDFEYAQKSIQRLEKNTGLFKGVPIPLKMLGQSKKGLPNTACSKLFKDSISSWDDNFVKQVERAGFVLFGQTNSPEFGYKNITDSKLYGNTRNVWDTRYFSGGSSGGASSAVASGMYPIACASDGGGSIRIPASWSSLIGLKPTRGRTPQGPNGFRGWQGAAISFGLTISVRDTARLLAELQTFQEEMPYQAPLLSREKLLTLAFPKKSLKIAFSTQSPVKLRVSEEAEKATQKTVQLLESLGHQIEEVAYPMDARPLIDNYYKMNAAETWSMFEEIQEKLKHPIQKKEVEPLTYCIAMLGKNISASEYTQSLNSWDAANHTFTEKIFATYDFFLTPTTAFTAQKIAEEDNAPITLEKLHHFSERSKSEQQELIFEHFERSLERTPYPFVANLTGQPAISLPVYLSEQGLPLGVQFMGKKGSEIELLELANQLEKEGCFILPKSFSHDA